MQHQHFNHKHFLIPLHFDNNGDESEDEIYCKACDRVISISEQFCGCLSCKYFLHDQCLNLPRSLQHPSHNSHPLTLLPIPTHSHGSYLCDACGDSGNSFSFSCAKCDFDLHIHCANLPTKLLTDAHPDELKLTFGIANDVNVSIVCDVCDGEVDKNFWIYRCEDCGFDCHLDCVKSNQQVKTEETEAEAEEGGECRENDAMDSMRQVANQMMEDQLEMMRLQNQLNRTMLMTNLMTSAWRRI